MGSKRHPQALRILAVTLVIAVVAAMTLVSTGCKEKTPPPEDKAPNAVETVSPAEQPTHTEHPAAEHPKAEHPK